MSGISIEEIMGSLFVGPLPRTFKAQILVILGNDKNILPRTGHSTRTSILRTLMSTGSTEIEGEEIRICSFHFILHLAYFLVWWEGASRVGVISSTFEELGS